MASLIIISWRDIPAQVIVKRGRETAKVQLSARFQEAVDRAAMRAGKGSSDAYLADWRRTPRPAAMICRPKRTPKRRAWRRATRMRTWSASSAPRASTNASCALPSPAPWLRGALMYAVRLWSVRHARGLNAFYRGFERVLVRLHGIAGAIGYARLERPVAAVERSVKGFLFDCQMCGQCVLSSTGMSCPMNCPKSLRNGPCGGVRDNGHCEVKPEMRCVWVEAFEGSQHIPGGTEAMSKRAAPVDRRLQGTSSWLRVVREKDRARAPGRHEIRRRAGPWLPVADSARPHVAGPSRTRAARRRVRRHRELAPPDSADPEEVYRRARVFDGYVDAINATDGSGANCHMSSLAVCALLTRVGYAPVMQISCRDKNRIAIQGDILGGAAMGVCNMLCLTGDGVQAGDHPQAKPVFDLDCMSLLEIARTLRDEHQFQSGRKITYAPRVFFGAAENPSAPAATPGARSGWRRKLPPARSSSRRSIATTCRCSGTSCERVEELGLLGQVFMLIGVGPLRSAKSAEWMRKHVPGMHVPDAIINRLAGAKDQAREGRNICIELIQEMPRDARRQRRARHGVSTGRIGARDDRPLRRAERARALVSGARPALNHLNRSTNDRYRNQFRHQGSRHWL